ncbi:MAG: hydantoinase/oxoprolinase family protein, partial [Alphaproteobacteria bacterium]|nr:hydantoinase/oxoprolinase family protein [Alphaproteobacteria bacterium]
EPRLPARASGSPRGARRIHLGGWLEAPVFDFESLAPGQTIAGPAIVESAMTTVLLRPHDRATVTPQGWLDIAVAPRGA